MVRTPVSRFTIEGFERAFVTFVITGTLGMVCAHLCAALLDSPGPRTAFGGAAGITWTVLLVALLLLVVRLAPVSPRFRWWVGLVLPIVAGAVVGARQGMVSAPAFAVFIAGILQAQSAVRLEKALPESLTGILRRHPAGSLSWAFLALLFLAQIGRLATYMADETSDWWLTTRNEFWAKHMCLPAYIEPADLQRQGVRNIYDAQYYTMLNRQAHPPLSVRNMDAYAGDPFQYPPQFLLAPALALALTNDFFTIRTVWFGLQLIAFCLVAFFLGRWLRPDAGWRPLLLIPLILISVPAMQSLQYGQFHLMAIVLAIGGMLCFAHKRHMAGGLLLAMSTVGKVFPGILIVWLLARHQWKSVGWTIGWAAGITVVALLVLGSSPFQSFVGYQLPRMASGEAFAFEKEWPELREILIGDNLSVGALPAKLAVLGVTILPAATGGYLLTAYSIFVLVLAVLFGRRGSGRVGQAAVWLALVNLAALQSPGAWGDYVTVGSVWLLTLIAWPPKHQWYLGLFLAVCWIYSFSLLGLQPIPDVPSAPVMMVTTLAGAVLVIGLNLWVICAGENHILGRSPAAVHIAGGPLELENSPVR